MSAHLLRVVTLSVALFLALAPTARAVDPIAFDFTARVTTVTNNGDLPLTMMNDEFSGTYIFDGDAPPIGQPAGIGLYHAMVFRVWADLPEGRFVGVTQSGHPTNQKEIRTNDFAINNTEDESYRAGIFGLVNQDIASLVVDLRSPGVDTLEIDGTNLPVLPLDPGAFSMATVAITTGGGSDVLADVLTLTLPEPTTAGSVAAVWVALAALGARARRRSLSSAL